MASRKRGATNPNPDHSPESPRHDRNRRQTPKPSDQPQPLSFQPSETLTPHQNAPVQTPRTLIEPQRLFSSPNPPIKTPQTLVEKQQQQHQSFSCPNPSIQTPIVGFFPAQHLQIPQLPLLSHQQHVRLLKADGSAAVPSTRFEELHSESQQIVIQIEGQIHRYKDESEMLDKCSRLNDASGDNFDHKAELLCQELKIFSINRERERISVQEMMEKVRNMMKNIDVAISFWKRRQMFTDVMLPKRPTPFLENTALRLEDQLTECSKWVDENEQLICMRSGGPSSSSSLSVHSIPTTMRNIHESFLHIAGRVSELHDIVEKMKKQFLLDRRRQGQESNPFLEADRREAARQEAASRRVHPTIHLSSSMPQPGIVAVVSNPTPQGQFIGHFGFPGFQPQASAFNIAWPSTAFAQSSTQSNASGFPPQSTAFATSQGQSSTQFGSSSFAPQTPNFPPATPPQFGFIPNPSLSGIATPSPSGAPSCPVASNPTPQAQFLGHFGFSGFQPQSSAFNAAWPSTALAQSSTQSNASGFPPQSPFATLQGQPSAQFGSTSFPPRPSNLPPATQPHFGYTPNPSLSGIANPSPTGAPSSTVANPSTRYTVKPKHNRKRR